MDLGEFVFGSSARTVYDLYSVAQHHGSLQGGHYTAVGRTNPNAFALFDDSRCSQNVSELVDSSAYVLFYVRRGEGGGGGGEARV